MTTAQNIASSIDIALSLTMYIGIIHLREHNKFMRELEARQKMRREKAEKLKGVKP